MILKRVKTVEHELQATFYPEKMRYIQSARLTETPPPAPKKTVRTCVQNGMPHKKQITHPTPVTPILDFCKTGN